MTLDTITEFMNSYGLLAVFVVVFLEYLNLPGFPAGIIMPAAGMLASRGNLSFPLTLFYSVCAGLLGSWLLYLAGRLGGGAFLSWFRRKFPKQAPGIDRTIEFVNDKGGWGILGAKLLPAVRTIISIPAGVLQMNFATYTLFSALGITLWNLAFIGAGYFLGDAVFSMF